MVVQRIVPIYHSDAFKFLESSFINNEVFSMVRDGRTKDINMKLVWKSLKSLYFEKKQVSLK